MNIKNLIFLLLMICVLPSCKEIMIDISDPVIPESERVVLIEELTGVSCTNCPKGTAAVQNILSKFPERVLAIGIHGAFLAQPTSKSIYDFRNDKAKNLENWFQPWFGKPAASVNRVPTADDALMIDIPELWQAAVEKELQLPHQLNLLLKSTYDAATRQVTVELAAIPLEDLNGTYNISVYLLESKIIDAQSNGPIIEEGYVHNHVLREMLTNFDGDGLGSDLKKNEILNRTYSYILPSTPEGLWKAENMSVIAMVSHNDPTDKSVVQAAEVYVIE
jgi:hypothetical protein